MLMNTMSIINFLISPSGFVSVCLIVGLSTWMYKRTRRIGYFSICFGAFAYLLLSSGPISYALLKPLEFQYGTYQAEESHSEIKYIVVMAGYAVDEKYYPPSSKVNSASVYRLVEALNIWLYDRTRIIVITGSKKVPEVMAGTIMAMGVPSESIITETNSRNSYQSAKNIQAIVQNDRFALVTSAGHMPRSMSIFIKMGMRPIAAPTDFQSGVDPLSADITFSAQHLYFSELAMHEYAGLLWYRLKGYI